MRVLVTGGAGFIGSHLIDRLVAAGQEASVLDNLDPQVHGDRAEPRHIAGHIASGAVRFVRGAVTEQKAVEQSLDGCEVVVHLAAAVGVGQSMYHPYYYVHTNATGSGLLLELIAASPERFRKLIVASSMSLYGEGSYLCSTCGGQQGVPRTPQQLHAGRWEVACARCGGDMAPVPTAESKTPEIASVYAATKKHQEDLFLAFGSAYHIPTFALRFFNVFGPRQSLSNPYTGVAAIFLSRILNGKSPLVFEDGKQSRDFIDVRDVARALTLAVESEHKGAHVMNVGTGQRVTVDDVARVLARGLDSDVTSRSLGQSRAGDIRHCYADTRHAESLLGFTTEHTLETGVDRLIEWCRTESARDDVDASLDELSRRNLVR